jgi:hypothetical protein
MKAKIVLDESRYGRGLRGAWRWGFYEKNWRKSKKKKCDNDENEGSLVTVTDSTEPILYAVTKKQYKSWSKREIIVSKRSRLRLLRDQVNRIIHFLYEDNHCWFKKVKGYLYLRVFGYYIIISKYGLRIVKPKKNIKLFRLLYEYYIHCRYFRVSIK